MSFWNVGKPVVVIKDNALCLSNIPPPRAMGWPKGDAWTLLTNRFPVLEREIHFRGFHVSLRDSELKSFLGKREFGLSHPLLLGFYDSSLSGLDGGEKIEAQIPCFSKDPLRPTTSKAEIAFAILDKIKALAESDGGKFLTVFIPTIEEVRNQVPTGDHSELEALLSGAEMSYVNVWQDEELRATSAPGAKDNAWTVANHLSESGGEIVSEKIFRFLQRR